MTTAIRAAEQVARMHPEYRALLATGSMAVLDALEYSLADEVHRAHVFAVLDGAAPTFARELRALLKNARKARVV